MYCIVLCTALCTVLYCAVLLSKSQLNAKTTFACSKMLAQNDEKQPLIVHFWPRKVKNLAFSCDFDNTQYCALLNHNILWNVYSVEAIYHHCNAHTILSKISSQTLIKTLQK